MVSKSNDELANKKKSAEAASRRIDMTGTLNDHHHQTTIGDEEQLGNSEEIDVEAQEQPRPPQRPGQGRVVWDTKLIKRTSM